MIASKLGLVALAPGRAFSTRRTTSLSCGLGLGGTLPLPSMRLGVWLAEAEPSETASAIRYDDIEETRTAARIVAELEFVDIKRHIGVGHLVIGANNASLE